MKIKNQFFAALFLTALSVFMACEKNVISTPGEVPVGARVKFVHACSNCPGLLITANGQTINPTAMTYLSATVGAFPTANYAVLPTGEINLDFIRSDSSKSLFTSKVSLADGKYYSVYVGDTIPTPTISLVEDDIQAFQDTFFRVRFVNLLSGKTKDTLELIRKNDNFVVASGITYGKASEFKLITSGITADTFLYRKTGSVTPYPLAGFVSFTGGFKAQTFTIFAGGLNNKATGAQTPKSFTWRNR
jgi:Domain of unknown function (DUF4397)